MAVTNPYADVPDVQVLLNQLGGATLTIDGTSNPTTTTVEKWLDQFSAEVNSILTANGYSTVPATGTDDVLLIGRYVAEAGACKSYGAFAMFDDIPDKVSQWCKSWDSFIKRLTDGDLVLQDQEPRGQIGTILGAVYIED
jgi:hypothetical protein